ncbi:MAG: ABC transporter substrate-binding protein [Chloroflexi bacterium]|nr:ABC transporter substrate-binding protein [Chloroflexota bacterium]
MQTRNLMASCFAIVALLLAGCAPPAAPASAPKAVAPKPTTAATTTAPPPGSAAPAPTPKTAGEQPRYGGSLALPAAGDPPNLDIHRNVGGVVFGRVGPIYNGIVQYDQSNRVVPDLAERWEASSDGKVYTFFLRKGVTWHDGKPFTSADAKFSLERIGQYAGLSPFTGPVDNTETPDQDTLKVTLKYRQAGYLPILGHGRILIAPRHLVEAEKDLRRVAIGTGPFRLKEYQAGVSFRVEKNREYFIKGRPYLDEVSFYTIRDVSTRFAAFRTRRVDIYGHPPTNGELMRTHADILRRDTPQVLVRPYGSMQAYALMPNWDRAPWKDVRVRRAAFLAVDREKGLEVVSEGVGTLGISVFYGEWALPMEELMKVPGFRKPKGEDIAEAKRLLAEAGYPEGLRTTLVLRGDVPLAEKAATFVSEQLSTIGMDLRLQILDYGVYVDARRREDYDVMVMVANVDPLDPDASGGRYISRKLGAPWASGDDDKILELLSMQSQAATDAERKKIVFALQHRIAEVVPHIMIAWQGSFIAFWPRVKDYTAESGIFGHNKLEDIWLAQ